MIPRYEVPEIATVWSDETRMANWLEIELLAVEAWAELGVIPDADARACRGRAAFTVEAVLERELVTRHDVAAFLHRPSGVGDAAVSSRAARGPGGAAASPCRP